MSKKLKNNTDVVADGRKNRVRESLIPPPLLGLIGLIILLSILSPYFLTVKNLINVLRQVSIISIVSVGMTYVIITGGIDLSVGSVAALSGVVTGILLKQYEYGIAVSILLGIIVGALCGGISGILITSIIKMPPFISTLATMSIARGLSLFITGGRPVFNLPDSFKFLGGSVVLGVPIPVIVMLVIFCIAHINLEYGRTGLYYYAIGGDEDAARVSGIKTDIYCARPWT